MVVACAAAAAVVLGSPLVGDLRNALLRVFPRHYVLVISGGVALGGLLVLAACLRAITSDRPRRIGLLAMALLLAAISFAFLRSGNPNVDAVEAFHFVEYGVLTLLFFPFGHAGARWEAYLQAALATTVVAIADEWFQWFVPGRAGEWHDVLFDFLATACGLLLCLALDTRHGAGLKTGGHVRGRASSDAAVRGRASSDAPPRRGLHLGVHAAIVIVLLGAFLATLHLGHEIRDPEIGVFRSRFSAARLRELGDDRRREWGGGPPPAAGRYGREDQYEAEALWHVRRRNFGMDPDRKGDPLELDIAWRENQILERYFAAVMDAASAGGTAGHRLAPEQLAGVDARRAHGQAPFVSDAEALPIYLWPPALFWTIIAALAAAAVAAGAVVDRMRLRGRGSSDPPRGE
jgi:VanZ family protein